MLLKTLIGNIVSRKIGSLISLKRCYVCKNWHKLSNYYKNRTKSDGLCRMCKDCDKLRSNNRRKGIVV